MCVPILPGYISYYVGLGQREDELIEAGKLVQDAAHWILGGLAAMGQLTFFALMGIIILGLVVSSISPIVLALLCFSSSNFTHRAWSIHADRWYSTSSRVWLKFG